MGKMILLAGPSGSGKSTLAEKLTKEAAKAGKTSVTASADSWMVDAEGNYAFDYKRLDECHTNSFRTALVGMTTGVDQVIVDNTNTRPEETAPYTAIAKVFGYDIELRVLMPQEESDLEALAERNVHGVPLSTIKKQVGRLRQALKRHSR